MNEEEFINITFKINGEEDIERLIKINNLIVEKVNIIQKLKNIPKANIIQKEEIEKQNEN